MKTMDQGTANRIALINAITIAALVLGGSAALVILAATHDGIYTQLLAQTLPSIILAGTAALGLVGVGHSVASAFITKYTAQAAAAQAISQNQTQAQTTIAQVQAGAANGTPPPPLNPPSSGTVQ